MQSRIFSDLSQVHGCVTLDVSLTSVCIVKYRSVQMWRRRVFMHSPSAWEPGVRLKFACVTLLPTHFLPFPFLSLAFFHFFSFSASYIVLPSVSRNPRLSVRLFDTELKECRKTPEENLSRSKYPNIREPHPSKRVFHVQRVLRHVSPKKKHSMKEPEQLHGLQNHTEVARSSVTAASLKT